MRLPQVNSFDTGIGRQRAPIRWRTDLAATGRAARPADLMQRQFGPSAHNRLWVADSTSVSTWRGRYDKLKLNTGKHLSHLPNRPYPKHTPVFPSRDEVVEHLDRHAREDGIELRLNTELAESIDDRTAGVCEPRAVSSIPARW
jgi:hypothetical protein